MLKRNSHLQLLFAGVWSTVLCASAQANVAPQQIPFTPDAQVNLVLSNTNPNMVVVPGDRIVAIDSNEGMLGDSRGKTGQQNGGVVLTTVQEKPFTFYLRTEGGQSLSVVATPQKSAGKTYHLMSQRPVKRPAAQKWETSQPYVSTLVDIQKALSRGEVPPHFMEAPVTLLPTFKTLPAVLQAQPETMWMGGELRVYRYRVRNTGTTGMALPERLFSAPGVRSVMISPYTATLLPSGQATVFITMSAG
ncbi:TPA: type-F conjugative transfer system secretin TraK [Yersinia enterocolitica]